MAYSEDDHRQINCMDRKGPGKGMRYDAEWLLEKK
jgi:hypothetical protein